MITEEDKRAFLVSNNEILEGFYNLPDRAESLREAILALSVCSLASSQGHGGYTVVKGVLPK